MLIVWSSHDFAAPSSVPGGKLTTSFFFKCLFWLLFWDGKSADPRVRIQDGGFKNL